jgi:hypothetical protein
MGRNDEILRQLFMYYDLLGSLNMGSMNMHPVINTVNIKSNITTETLCSSPNALTHRRFRTSRLEAINRLTTMLGNANEDMMHGFFSSNAVQKYPYLVQT